MTKLFNESSGGARVFAVLAATSAGCVLATGDALIGAAIAIPALTAYSVGYVMGRMDERKFVSLDSQSHSVEEPTISP